MSNMTRLTKLTVLLYFKGKIKNKYVDLELPDNKEITSDLLLFYQQHYNYKSRVLKCYKEYNIKVLKRIFIR